MSRITIVAEPNTAHTGDKLVISTRSIMAAINYLSQGIESPQRDFDTGRVTMTMRDDGVTPFNWREMLDDVFRVRFAEADPGEEAAVSVHYRGVWFFIADNDLDTQSTFLLLQQLIQLHSAPLPGGPALSVNVGG